MTLRSVPKALRVAIQQRSLDQPGVLVAFIEDVLEEGTASMAAIGGGTTAVLGMGGTTDIDIVPIAISSSLPLPPPVPPTPLLSSSSSVAGVSSSKATEKRVRSRKGMKMVKKESPEEQGVSKGLWNGEEGRMEENAVAGVEKAGEEAASSQLGSCSVGGQSSRSNSVLFDGDSSSAEMSKNPHFHGFSQHLESCARLKTSELSAHQMPQILNAERSSNASSASRVGGSTLDPWEQASRESNSSLVSGELLPEGFEDSFVRLSQKARPAQKRIQKRVALMK